jgi:hypothetical protein
MSELIEVSFSGKDANASHACMMAIGDGPGEIPLREDGMLDVHMTINGAEVSFRNVIERYKGAWECAVQEEAKRMLKEHMTLGPLVAKLQSIEWEMDEFIAKAFPEARP